MFNKKQFLKICRFNFIILCFIFIILSSQCVIAHTPSNMILDYNSENQKLEVTITHKVSDAESHFIYSIIIKKNGETYKNYEYTNQPSSSSFNYYYDINASQNDIIELNAFCNQGGSIKEQLTVGIENGVSDGSNGSSTPGFEIFLIIVSFFIVIFLKRQK